MLCAPPSRPLMWMGSTVCPLDLAYPCYSDLLNPRPALLLRLGLYTQLALLIGHGSNFSFARTVRPEADAEPCIPSVVTAPPGGGALPAALPGQISATALQFRQCNRPLHMPAHVCSCL